MFSEDFDGMSAAVRLMPYVKPGFVKEFVALGQQYGFRNVGKAIKQHLKDADLADADGEDHTPGEE